MAKLMISAIATLCGLWLVFVEENLDGIAVPQHSAVVSGY
jgi:hypothetical protein